VADDLPAAPESKRILLIEPDERMRDRVEAILLGAGHDVIAPAAEPQVLEAASRGDYDAAVVALEWAGSDATHRLRGLRRVGEAAVLVLCEPRQIPTAVQLLRDGADDYLLRPPDPVEVRTRLARILEHRELNSRMRFFQREMSRRADVRSLEVRSPAMRLALDQLLRVAPMRSTVLIHGESGVGKELVARAIHFNSPRQNGPFIALNCAAIPASLVESELFGHERGSFTGAHSRSRGKFEIAHGGTLFLDEIGEIAPTTQVKLLRVLEEREFMRVGGSQSVRVDVRVIAATNADLDLRIARGEFRQDLYYRLKVVTIHVPPLRERQLDIPHLARGFLDELSRANAVEPKSINDEALACLNRYSWPGNVRELKNLIESLLVSVTGREIGVEDLPPYVRLSGSTEPAPFEPGTTLLDMERDLIRRTLEWTGGNRTHSAQLLGIGVRTLQRKVRSYGLTVRPVRRRKRQRP
jgi:DNA-binding NtrC family response regulator